MGLVWICFVSGSVWGLVWGLVWGSVVVLLQSGVCCFSLHEVK